MTLTGYLRSTTVTLTIGSTGGVNNASGGGGGGGGVSFFNVGGPIKLITVPNAWVEKGQALTEGL